MLPVTGHDQTLLSAHLSVRYAGKQPALAWLGD